jgi:hypothetical protein
MMYNVYDSLDTTPVTYYNSTVRAPRKRRFLDTHKKPAGDVDCYKYVCFRVCRYSLK